MLYILISFPFWVLGCINCGFTDTSGHSFPPFFFFWQIHQIKEDSTEDIFVQRVLSLVFERIPELRLLTASISASVISIGLLGTKKIVDRFPWQLIIY